MKHVWLKFFKKYCLSGNVSYGILLFDIGFRYCVNLFPTWTIHRLTHSWFYYSLIAVMNLHLYFYESFSIVLPKITDPTLLNYRIFRNSLSPTKYLLVYDPGLACNITQLGHRSCWKYRYIWLICTYTKVRYYVLLTL